MDGAGGVTGAGVGAAAGVLLWKSFLISNLAFAADAELGAGDAERGAAGNWPKDMTPPSLLVGATAAGDDETGAAAAAAEPESFMVPKDMEPGGQVNTETRRHNFFMAKLTSGLMGGCASHAHGHSIVDLL